MDADQVIQRLPLRSAQFQSCGFLLDQQSARPEQVDKALFIIKQLYPLFVDRNGVAFDAKDFEKIVLETLGFALFIMGGGPLHTKRLGAPFNLVPAKPHVEIPLAPLTARMSLANQAKKPLA